MKSAVWGRQAASAESVWYSPGTLITGQLAGEGVLSRAEFSGEGERDRNGRQDRGYLCGGTPVIVYSILCVLAPTCFRRLHV